MSKKTYYITLWIGVALGFTALILGFLCKFGLAFLFMMITYAYAGCLENSWRDTFFRGFEEKEYK